MSSKAIEILFEMRPAVQKVLERRERKAQIEAAIRTLDQEMKQVEKDMQVAEAALETWLAKLRKG